MKYRHLVTAALLSVIIAPVARAALGDYGEPKFAKNVFAQLNADLRLPVVTSNVTKFAADKANNVWLSTEGGGLAALRIEGDTLTRFSTAFPINKSAYPEDYLLSNSTSAIVFGKFKTDEFFFFSSDDPGGNAGLQWGRYTDRVDLRPLIELDGETNVEVHDLATDGTKRVWVASEKGVFEVDLTTGETPQPTAASPYTAPSPETERVAGVVDATSITGVSSAIFYTWPDGRTLDGGKWLFYIDPAQGRDAQVIGKPFSNALIGAIRVVGNELYVVQRNADTTDDARKRTIVKYTYSGGEWTRNFVADFFPDLGVYNDSGFNINDIDVSPTDGVVWLATTGFAFFQVPDAGVFDQRVCYPGNWEDPSDDYYSDSGAADCTTVGSGWRHIFKRSSAIEGVSNETFQNYGSLLVDRGENAWLGSDYGVRGFISRFLSLNATRFIGLGKTAIVSLDDVDPGAGGYIKITVASKSAKVNAVFDENGRMVPIYFGFTFSEVDPSVSPTPNPLLFPVTSTADGVPVTVEYYRSAADTVATLTAAATWAQIIAFEDDAFIGGPCFLKTIWLGE
jgi:hypothetical protein